MPISVMRPIQAVIHQAALQHNLAVIKTCAPASRVMAVVKANGYGHGLLRAAAGLGSADGFAVLGLQEAIQLRESGYQQQLLLLEGVFHEAELHAAAAGNISMVVHNEEQLGMLEQAHLPTPVAVFVKLNSGMNRLGFHPERYVGAVERLAHCPNVAGITLMTHFARADEATGIDRPLSVFRRAAQGLNYPVSLANSAAILRYPETHTDWIRPGIALYGATPIANVPARQFGLHPAMTLQSEIIAVQELVAGDSVGYGGQFTAAAAMRVGTVACGYADGYPRHAPTGTPIAVDGRLTRTLGRVSMDMLAVDLTALDGATVGSRVELWGELVPVDAVAASAGTLGYELLCAVAPRVPVKVKV